MAIFRMAFSLPFAALMTFGLFLAMATMIKSPLALNQAKTSPNITITPQIEPTQPRTPLKNRYQEITEAPPPTDLDFSSPTEKPTPNFARVKAVPFEKIVPGGPVVIGTPIRTAPSYPNACLARGREGSVLVQFDITPEGHVVNPIILETPDRCFNRTVISTVTRWRYPPAYKNDRAVMRSGIVERITFELAG